MASAFIQLGSSGSFVAPCSGWAVFQCVDGVRSDNSGSLSGTVNGVSYTAQCATDTAGPYLVQGQTYSYSFSAGEYWYIGSGAYFNADGLANASNTSPYTSPPFPELVGSGQYAGLLDFSLVLRVDAPFVNPNIMEQHGFSTGTLYLRPVLSPLMAYRQPGGAGALVALPGITTPTTTETAFASAASAANGQWAVVDLGAAIDVALVKLYGCFDSPAMAAGAQVWVASSISATPGGAGTTALVMASSAVTGVAQTVTLDATAAPVNGRYLIIATANAGAGLSMSFDWLQVYTDSIQLAVVQEGSAAVMYDDKLLYTDRGSSAFPIDVAFYGGKMTFSGKNVGIRADAVAQLAKSVLSGSNPLVNTVGPKFVTIPEGILTFNALDTNGKTIVYILQHARSKGIKLEAKLDDYMMQGFDFFSFAGTDGVVGYMQMHT